MLDKGEFKHARVLVLDDQATSRIIFTHVVKSIHTQIESYEFENSIEALDFAQKNALDLIIADYMMPDLDGIEFTRKIRELPQHKTTPVLMISMMNDTYSYDSALEAGANEFLVKPINVQESIARCRNLLTMKIQQDKLDSHAQDIEKLVAFNQTILRAESTNELAANVYSKKSDDDAGHLLRMSEYSRALAEAIGLSRDEVLAISLATPLHDIGKIGVNQAILNKNGPLTDEEYAEIRRHTQIGYDILEGSPSAVAQVGAEIAFAHHERFDGTGYPNKLKGNNIPLPARIAAIAEVFDILLTRKNKDTDQTINAALAYLQKESGKHFDPALVEKMTQIKPKLEKIHAENYHPLN